MRNVMLGFKNEQRASTVKIANLMADVLLKGCSFKDQPCGHLSQRT